ncbi:MAG: hypothetical protein ACRD2W_10600 [Acidimicrobiales bacterium]
MSTEQARIIVIEDNEALRSVVTTEITSHRDAAGSNPYAVVGQAANVEDARVLIRTADYSVVVLDLSLIPWPEFHPHGFELAPLVHEIRPEARIVLWSQYTTVEGDLLRRAAQPWGDRFLVDAIVAKEQPLPELLEAIHVVRTMPSVYFWVDRGLRPPRSYSAILAFTHAEDEWIRDFAQNPGSNPRDVMARLGINRSNYADRRGKVVAKIVRELRDRNDKLLDKINGADALDDVELARGVTDTVILDWARKRHLDWPMTEGERQARPTLRTPNAPSAAF